MHSSQSVTRAVANGRSLLGMLLVAAMPFLSACGPASLAVAPASPQASAQPAPTQAKVQAAKQIELTESELKNATYELPSLGAVQLQEGKYELKLGPGATQVNKAGYQTAGFGDLDGDGAKDAAVILWSDTGGSGTFIYLIAVQNQNGAPRQMASLQIGDREKIGAVSVDAGKIAIQMTTFGPKDPKCCPSQQETRTYQLTGGALKQIP